VIAQSGELLADALGQRARHVGRDRHRRPRPRRRSLAHGATRSGPPPWSVPASHLRPRRGECAGDRGPCRHALDRPFTVSVAYVGESKWDTTRRRAHCRGGGEST